MSSRSARIARDEGDSPSTWTRVFQRIDGSGCRTSASMTVPACVATPKGYPRRGCGSGIPLAAGDREENNRDEGARNV